MKIKNFTSAIVLSFLLLAAFALADSDDAKNLAVRSDRIGCTIDFHNAIMSSIVSKIPQASDLNSWSSKLQADKTQLQSTASGGDNKAFSTYVKDTLNQDMKQADDAVRAQRKNYKSYNVSKEIRQSLNDDYKKAQSAYSDCIKSNDVKVAENRVDYYNNVLAKRQKQIDNLANRSVDTAQLSSIISQAQTTIVAPLQNAVNSGDTSQAQSALKQYCLWNGCRNGTNFHLDARFEQARLSALLAKIMPIGNAAGLQSDVSAVQSQLDAAKSAIDSLGAADETKDTSAQIWNPLKQAAQDFRKLIADIRRAISV